MKQKRISMRDIGWLEGILDGEGALYMYKNRKDDCKRGFQWIPCVIIESTSQKMIERVYHIIGIGCCVYEQHRRNGRKTTWTCRLRKNGITQTLPKLRLTVKEPHRLLLIEAAKLIEEHRSGFTPNDRRLGEIYHQLKVLNS